MNKMIALAAVSAAALSAVPAAAQTAPAGGRVEALIAYDRLKIDVSDLGIDDSVKDSGTTLGLGAGYDFAIGNTASAGVDVEISESTIEEGDDVAEIEIGRDLYAGGRVSFGVGTNTTAYVKAGYTNLRVRGKIGDVSEAANLDGFRIGGGAQYGIGGKAYVGGEYRYSNYEADVSRHQLALTLGTRF